MSARLRQPVGRTLLSGYLVVRPDEEAFFDPAPGRSGRRLSILFEPDQQVEARLIRSGGREARLKLAFTGPAGAAFRSWLRKRFPARKTSRVRGVLVLERLDAGRFRAQAESVSEAEVELLSPGPRVYLAGARPVCILHPAMIDLEEGLRRVSLPAPAEPLGLAERIAQALGPLGWSPVGSVGAGLALDGGLRRANAQLHLVPAAEALWSALVSLAAGFELGGVDLGVLLVVDGRLAERLRRQQGGTTASLKRARRELSAMSFLVRGPVCLLGLATRKQIQ